MPPFVSTSALVLEDARILVVIDPIRREPILPGGHLRWREMPEHALVREVREETGLIIMPGELVDVVAREELTGEPGVVRVIYAASVTGGTLASSGEGEARWMPIDEAAAASKRDGEIIRGWRERTAKVTAAR